MNVSISKPDHSTTVCFKDEDDVDGMRIGPVYFRTEHDDVVAFEPAYSDSLDFLGNPAAGWLTYREAEKIAKHFGLPFEAI